MPKRLLIVEDVALVAMDLESQAADAGWEVVGPAATVAEAQALLDHHTVEAALLDVQVGDELITAVAERLHAQGVPFVFGSGYKASALLPPALQAAPSVEKPYTFPDVERALKACLSERAA